MQLRNLVPTQMWTVTWDNPMIQKATTRLVTPILTMICFQVTLKMTLKMLHPMQLSFLLLNTPSFLLSGHPATLFHLILCSTFHKYFQYCPHYQGINFAFCVSPSPLSTTYNPPENCACAHNPRKDKNLKALVEKGLNK